MRHTQCNTQNKHRLLHKHTVLHKANTKLHKVAQLQRTNEEKTQCYTNELHSTWLHKCTMILNGTQGQISTLTKTQPRLKQGQNLNTESLILKLVKQNSLTNN